MQITPTKRISRGLSMKGLHFPWEGDIKMTDERRIRDLQAQGYGYKKIATTLGLPENSVKSYCRRHPITDTCPQCGKPLKHTAHHKKKKFCSDICRRSWWNAHRHLINHKSGQSLQCENCGKTFYPNGHKSGRFCSRTCYLSHIRKEVSNNDQ